MIEKSMICDMTNGTGRRYVVHSWNSFQSAMNWTMSGASWKIRDTCMMFAGICLNIAEASGSKRP